MGENRDAWRFWTSIGTFALSLPAGSFETGDYEARIAGIGPEAIQTARANLTPRPLEDLEPAAWTWLRECSIAILSRSSASLEVSIRRPQCPSGQIQMVLPSSLTRPSATSP